MQVIQQGQWGQMLTWGGDFSRFQNEPGEVWDEHLFILGQIMLALLSAGLTDPEDRGLLLLQGQNDESDSDIFELRFEPQLNEVEAPLLQLPRTVAYRHIRVPVGWWRFLKEAEPEGHDHFLDPDELEHPPAI
jgi:hypothetical protein